jgi:uncharacterized membrane protein
MLKVSILRGLEVVVVIVVAEVVVAEVVVAEVVVAEVMVFVVVFVLVTIVVASVPVVAFIEVVVSVDTGYGRRYGLNGYGSHKG